MVVEIDLCVGGVFFVFMIVFDGILYLSKGFIKEIILEEKLLIEGDFDVFDVCGVGLLLGVLIKIFFEEIEGGILLMLFVEFLFVYVWKVVE